MAEIELHDEITAWLDGLTQEEWERAVVVVDRLAELGSTARMPLSRSLGKGLYELRFTLGPYSQADHLQVYQGRSDHPAHDLPQTTQQRAS